MAYHGKSKFFWRKYYTRKSWHKWGEQRWYVYSYYVGKKQKQQYNRWLRNSQKVPELKNNNWKKTSGANLYNWF